MPVFVTYTVDSAEPRQTQVSDPGARREVNESHGLSPSVITTTGWTNLIRDELYNIPGVESVYFSLFEDSFDIWALIRERDLDLVRQITNAQRKIIQDLSVFVKTETFFIDFHVIYRAGRAEKELVPRRAVKVSRLP